MYPVFYFALLVGVGFLEMQDVTCITNKDFLEELAIQYDADIYVRNQGASCSCEQNSCSCCASQPFKAFLKSWTFTGCIRLTYLPDVTGYLLSIRYNNKEINTQKISFNNPPKLCFPVPGIPIANVCTELFNINLGQKSLCAKMTGNVNLWYKTWSVYIDLSCFKIPTL